jgi:hypothetical protein
MRIVARVKVRSAQTTAPRYFSQFLPVCGEQSAVGLEYTAVGLEHLTLEGIMKNKNTRDGIFSIVFAVIVAIAGAIAYANDYYIVLFRFIPLNEVAFGIVAAALLVFGIYRLISGRKKDQTITENFQAQQQAASSLAQFNPPCTVVVTREKSVLGGKGKLNVLLNGFEVGKIDANKQVALTTSAPQNILTFVYGPNNATSVLNFTAIPGGVVNIVCGVNKAAQPYANLTA